MWTGVNAAITQFAWKEEIVKKLNCFNVGIYVRLSRDDNNGNLESMSISNQKQILSDYVKEKGWDLVETYVEM